MRSFGLLLHDCRKATLCSPYLVLGLHARTRPHHSIGEGQCAEGSTRAENREVLVQPVKTGITPPLAIPSCGQAGEKGRLRRAERLHERQ